MDRHILIQYADMKQRIKMIRERIRKIEREIEELRKMEVADTVSGGMGGTQRFKVEGRPDGLIWKKEKLLQKRCDMLEREELELLILTNEAEEYIQSVEPIELRMMFDLYYLQDLDWTRTAYRMNRMYPNRKIPYTAESCRQRNKRFFDKID